MRCGLDQSRDRSLELGNFAAAKKAQGKRLGNPKLVAVATKRDKVLRPVLKKLADQPLRAMAAELDRRGIKSWSKSCSDSAKKIARKRT